MFEDNSLELPQRSLQEIEARIASLTERVDELQGEKKEYCKNVNDEIKDIRAEVKGLLEQRKQLQGSAQ